MKKTLLTCLAIVAVFAVASSASAVTCTIDQRPAATLLVPYFQVSYGPGGQLISTGLGARDTIVTIGNASSSPMIAHVNVYDRFSELVLDFNVALTGFDVQAMRISDIIGGNLPNTPIDPTDGEPVGDVCQRADPDVYPDPDGFIRVFPLVPATTLDNTLATTEYNQQFFSVAESLRRDCFDELGPLAIGYIVIDHANYCNLSDPTDPNYYYNNALGNENNLFGEIIFTSGEGIPTYAMSTVNIEADSAIAAIAGIDITRTFYARYWEPAITGIPYLPANNCPNCGSGNPETDLSISSPWNIPGGSVGAGIGDGREPLGLKWAARWFDLGLTITSNFRAWRSTTFNPDSDGCDVLRAPDGLDVLRRGRKHHAVGRLPFALHPGAVQLPAGDSAGEHHLLHRRLPRRAGWLGRLRLQHRVRVRPGVGRLRLPGRAGLPVDPRSRHAARSVQL